MIDLLAPGGGLARAIPHYEDRAEQRAMSAAVTRALDEARPLIVEAGTGTGKTLAYLVPALESGKRVVVSTGTRALQDQIARHDIPLLRTIVARPFTAVVLKGVANYVCRRKLAEAAPHAPNVQGIVDWAEHSETGDRAEVEWLPESAPIWTDVTTTPDARIGPRCPYFERCFVTQARRLAERADLILVNHHLYFADRALRAAAPGAKVLPEHDAVIFDEAHQLEDVATEHFGARISTHALAQLVRDAHLALVHLPLWTGRTADDVIRAVERAGATLFAHVRGALVGDADRVPLPDGLFDHPERQRAWFQLDTALEELARTADAEGEPAPDAEEDGARAALAGLARRARGLRDDLAMIAEQRGKSHVYWGEARATGTALTASPIEVGELVRRHVVTAGPTAIFTSATLATAATSVAKDPVTQAATAGEFAYSRARLGLADADELLVPSPFDYARQAMLYVPRDLPAPGESRGAAGARGGASSDDSFAAAAAARTLELLALTSGRAFLLFTSHRALREAAARLADLPYPRLVQGDAPRATLVDRFRATPGAVLFGTASFWEGVDVPGDALSLVVIDKLPFAPHVDPLVAARMQACAERGGDPFAELQLPAAALALKQGFGRLIRRRDDRGIVAILDSRIVTRTYGRVFLDTLPTGLPRTSALEQVRRWWLTTSS
ncbi:MAG TPA: ATP-dependent DNA helicase [Kofleriaceae bacterium]|nr:ATP-dependent DNA helicase [Kofleriaceae bacterium]